MSIKTLAKHVGAKQKSMHYPLKCLQQKNMVELHGGEYDKRETLVSLTPAARKMDDDYNAASIVAEYDIFGGISDEDIDELNNVLKQARTLLEKYFPASRKRIVRQKTRFKNRVSFRPLMQLKLDAFARGLTVLEGMLFRFDVRNIIRPVLYRRSNGVPREDDLQLLRLVVEKIQQAFFPATPPY